MALWICSVAALLVHSVSSWLFWRFSWQSFESPSTSCWTERWYTLAHHGGLFGESLSSGWRDIGIGMCGPSAFAPLHSFSLQVRVLPFPVNTPSPVALTLCHHCIVPSGPFLPLAKPNKTLRLHLTEPPTRHPFGRCRSQPFWPLPSAVKSVAQ